MKSPDHPSNGPGDPELEAVRAAAAAGLYDHLTKMPGEHERLREFVRESNRIEGIMREPTEGELTAHAAFLPLRTVTVADVESFVAEVADAPLRRSAGMNVRVGNHRPPPGGLQVERKLADLLYGIRDRIPGLTPYRAHVRYETLHPFLDGNGRSGRVLWAWQMLREGQDPFALPFLHRFYYQALDGAR